ncbi:terpene cyclase/mutase family protein [Nocardioides sp. KC13]|uniref:Terpene cyclase/mutase family protein n=1 Tax=Nocardioides turkmenicus TaxID=2711220 RepID=A0A6M1QRK6_9ACTN|nr:prenyltransferase/squalene oxidase repeat-containing protein [Nocardioides sp. KC13]NGN92473.1 terpene cyclase/mutase family protein [Nocardioides sp. KC13]
MKKTVLGGIAAALALTSLAGCGEKAVEEGEKPTYDAKVSTSVADWLVAQAPKGVAHNAQYGTDDFGLSADIGIALAEVGGYDEEIATIAAAVMKNKKAYTSPGFGTAISAGATAKALVLQQNVDASDPGLLKQLEDTVADNGRIADQLDPKNKKAADYSNTIGQSYAVWALSNAESKEAAGAAEFLAGQQCEEGWFRVTFTADPAAADQTCDGDPKATPDADATAFALIALSSVSSPEAEKAVKAGVEWLKETQAEDGSFKAATGNVANSNTTGLAGWAFGRAGETDAAEKAASWVAEHVVTCGDDAGAVAYDDAALTEGNTKGLTKESEGMYRLAAAQALPSLVFLPKDATAKSSC